MDDHEFRRAVRELRDRTPPSFEQVADAPAGRRVRRLRVGAAALALILALAASLLLATHERQPEFALRAPPTTDWLLQTPDPAWVARLDDDNNEEP